jgi:hypothetical protein
VKIQVDIFWVVTPCSVVVGYQPFGEPCCFHLQGEVNGTGKGRHRYRRRQNPAASRNQEREVILAAGVE